MNFAVSMAGLLVCVGAGSLALVEVGLSVRWVGMIATALVGLGVIAAVGRAAPEPREQEQLP